MSWKNSLMISTFTFGIIWLEKNVKITAWGSFISFFVFVLFSSSSTEECDEDDLGSVGSPRGKHKAECGQTGGQPSAEQHAQHQYRAGQSQHTGSDTSKCFLSNESMWQKEYPSYCTTSSHPVVLWALDFKISQMTNVWDTNTKLCVKLTHTQGKICCYLNCGHSKVNVIFFLLFPCSFPMTDG